MAGYFSKKERCGELNQTSELSVPQIHSDQQETQESHQFHSTTKSSEIQSGVLENSPDEDKTKQYDRRYIYFDNCKDHHPQTFCFHTLYFIQDYWCDPKYVFSPHSTLSWLIIQMIDKPFVVSRSPAVLSSSSYLPKSGSSLS